MPIIFKGNHICEKCIKEFEWINFEIIKSKLSSGIFQVERIPMEPKAYRVECLDNDSYKIYINCPYCGYDNKFIYNESDNT